MREEELEGNATTQINGNKSPPVTGC